MSREGWITVSLGVLIAGCEIVAELDGFEDEAPGTGGVASAGGGGTSTSAGGSASGGGGGFGGVASGGATAGGAGEAGSGGATPPPCDVGFDFINEPTSGQPFTAYYTNTTAFTYVGLVVDPVPDLLERTGVVTGRYTWSWDVLVNVASPTLHTFTFTHQQPPVAVASCQVWIGP